MKYQPINPVLFGHNRKRFMRKMQPDSIAIFYSNDLMPRDGSTFFPFRQNSSLFYLSGLDQAETVVVLFPDCIKDGFQELAFVKRTNEFSRIWDGNSLTKADAQAISGIRKVFWLDEMDHILHELILLSKRIYINAEEDDLQPIPFDTQNRRAAKELINKYPAHKFHRSQPVLKKLMMLKNTLELELIQEAINISEHAFRRVLGFVKPGQKEYEIEAEITHEFVRRGANGHAYPPIIAGGGRACILHYAYNNQTCQDGDLLLMDFGAEYANYASDITRVIPVNGQFSPRQKDVYQAVLKVVKEAQQLLVPGILLEEYNVEIGKIMEHALVDLALISRKEIEQQHPDYPLYKKYFMHSPAHHLGLGVHDLSNRYDPVMAGMVFTCEPGIYLPKEQIGIRIENNLLVTDESTIDLSANIPSEVEEIEELMAAGVVLS